MVYKSILSMLILAGLILLIIHFIHPFKQKDKVIKEIKGYGKGKKVTLILIFLIFILNSAFIFAEAIYLLIK